MIRIQLHPTSHNVKIDSCLFPQISRIYIIGQLPHYHKVNSKNINLNVYSNNQLIWTRKNFDFSHSFIYNHFLMANSYNSKVRNELSKY